MSAQSGIMLFIDESSPYSSTVYRQALLDCRTQCDLFDEQVQVCVPGYSYNRISGGMGESMSSNLKCYQNGKIVEIVGNPDPTNYPLRIRKAGNTIGIKTVETTDSRASNIRIKLKTGIKALEWGVSSFSTTAPSGRPPSLTELQTIFLNITGFDMDALYLIVDNSGSMTYHNLRPGIDEFRAWFANNYSIPLIYSGQGNEAWISWIVWAYNEPVV